MTKPKAYSQESIDACLKALVRPKAASERAPSEIDGPTSSLSCDALVRLLRNAELEYKAAVLEYEKAEAEGVSSFWEHNTASYKKGICDAYRNLLKPNNGDVEHRGQKSS
jgi:hypothetical protein